MAESADEILEKNKQNVDEKLRVLSALKKLVGHFVLLLAVVVGIYSGYGLINGDLPDVNLAVIISVLVISLIFAVIAIKNPDKTKILTIVAPIVTVIVVFTLFYLLR